MIHGSFDCSLIHPLHHPSPDLYSLYYMHIIKWYILYHIYLID
jgi:hypothetical protein